MFTVIGQDNFGLADPLNPDIPQALDLSIGRPSLTGLAIDPTSEIDQCWVSFPGASTSGGLFGARSGGSPSGAFYGIWDAGSNGFIPPGSVLLTRSFPILGPIPGPIMALPYYRWFSNGTPFNKGGAINTQGDSAVGRLAVRTFYEPVSYANLGARIRAPLVGGWHSSAGANRVVLPVFGRPLIGIVARSAAGATLGMDFGWISPGPAAAGRCHFIKRAPFTVIADAANPNGFATIFNGNGEHFITFYETGGSTVDSLIVTATGQESG